MKYLNVDELDDLTPNELLDYLILLKCNELDLRAEHVKLNTRIIAVEHRLQRTIEELKSSINTTEFIRTEQIPKEAFIKVGKRRYINTNIDDDLEIQ